MFDQMDVIDLFGAVIADSPIDRNTECIYRDSAGSPVCVIGRMLRLADLDFLVLPRDSQLSTIEHQARWDHAGTQYHEFMLHFTQDAFELMSELQQAADHRPLIPGTTTLAGYTEWVECLAEVLQ